MSEPGFDNEQPMPNGTRAMYFGTAITHLRSPDGATAIVADHGAHILSWRPAGFQEMLYLSPTSGYGSGTAIRGGVPVIFPQFGELGLGKRHGFARVLPWQCVAVEQCQAFAKAEWRLRGCLPKPPETMPQIASEGSLDFELSLIVQIGGPALNISLAVTNRSAHAWVCHAALHTYLRIADLAQVRLDNLQGAAYIDQSDVQPSAKSSASKWNIEPASAVSYKGNLLQQAEPRLAFAGEVDRIYLDAPPRLALQDGQRRLLIEQQGFADTVVWNPGAKKASALNDLPAGEERRFVCIEAAAVGHQIRLDPGASWQGMQKLSVDLDRYPASKAV